MTQQSEYHHISRIDQDGGSIVRSPGHAPSDMVYADHALWISYADRATDGSFELGVARLDPVIVIPPPRTFRSLKP